jgi:hypothetical protein
MPVEWRGETMYCWEPCSCRRETWEAAQRRQAALQLQYRASDPLEEPSLEALSRHMTLERFDQTLLRNDVGDAHPYTVGTSWLRAIEAYGPRADVTDSNSPPQALYFYSPQPGCGKTHLAAGLGYHARDVFDRRVAVIIEDAFLQQVWGVSLADKGALLDRLAVRPWLTIIDALGQREDVRASVRNEYYALINRRYSCGGWTVMTSNFTPDELVEYGVLHPYAYSRLVAMIGGQVLYFDGEDRRGLGFA